MTICLRCYISGKVQGVFYRRETCNQANKLKIKGWAKNLADGRVEVMLCGEDKNVQEMCDWLWQGPERAEVSNVEIIEEPFQSFNEFEVR
jgi:acylphosphatase